MGNAAEVKRGKWLKGEEWDEWFCSVCRERAYLDQKENPILSYYCPHCGTRNSIGSDRVKIDKLDGRYNAGYIKALIDVKNFFEDHSEVMKRCRLNNQKGISALLKLILENHEELRETGDIENVIVYRQQNKIVIKKASD